MVDSVRFIPELLKWEGATTWIYRDVVGYATVAVGNLLHDADDACALPFFNVTEGRAATTEEIRREFVRVMSCQRGQRASAYRATKLTPRIELSDGYVAILVRQRLEKEFLPGLRKMCPGFDAFPEPAQACLVDLAYNLGIGRPATADHKATGLTAFGDLRAACNRGDWETAARECHVSTSRPERNAWRAERLRAAANNAQ